MHTRLVEQVEPRRVGLKLPQRCIIGDFAAQARLTAALADLRWDWSLLAPFICFSPSGYVRRRLYVGDLWEVLLMCWLPGQGTRVHDHGQCVGFTRTIFGELTEVTYRQSERNKPLRRVAVSKLSENTIGHETSRTIHRVSNEQKMPALSLHLYSPPLRRYNAYDVDTGVAAQTMPSTWNGWT